MVRPAHITFLYWSRVYSVAVKHYVPGFFSGLDYTRGNWCARMDSNHRPPGEIPGALIRFSAITPSYYSRVLYTELYFTVRFATKHRLALQHRWMPFAFRLNYTRLLVAGLLSHDLNCARAMPALNWWSVAELNCRPA